MTAPYILPRSAAADLQEVVRYTLKAWGEPQRKTYIAQIEEAAEALALPFDACAGFGTRI